MSVYYKNGKKYVGTLATIMKNRDNNNSTTTNSTTTANTSSNSSSTSGSTANKTSSGSSASVASSGNKNSQYTGSSTSIITHNDTQQAIKDQMNANSIAWWEADETEKARLKAENQSLAALLGGTVTYNPNGTWSGEAEGADIITKDDILDWEYEEEKPVYNSKYDAQTEALLNEILNREDFSYDAMNDPLYQQYAAMYQREGDRAMKETLAEAAAGAGGMNTYAITAAQQANNYYGSKLNDIIPELYQAAYEKYLGEKESKVQDLGLLQSMDNTQYNRYRDTMSDFYSDRNFAYGAYQDAVQQGNWQANFDNNNYWANKEFDYNDMWANKEWNYNDEWKNKEWDASQADKDYNRTQAEEESAKAEIEWYIKNGVTTISPELIAKAGLDQTAVSQMIAYYQQQQAPKVTSSGGGGGNGGNGGNGNGYKGGNDGNDNSNSVPVIDEGDGSVMGLGIGAVSDDLLEKLAVAGAIVGDDDGNLYWADGWNNANYRERLTAMSGYGNLLTLPMLKF